VIVAAKDPLPEAEEMDGKPDKLSTHFSDKPAAEAA
jgi:ferredoxin